MRETVCIQMRSASERDMLLAFSSLRDRSSCMVVNPFALSSYLREGGNGMGCAVKAHVVDGRLDVGEYTMMFENLQALFCGESKHCEGSSQCFLHFPKSPCPTRPSSQKKY